MTRLRLLGAALLLVLGPIVVRSDGALTHYYPLDGNGNAAIGAPNGVTSNGPAAAIDRHNFAGGAVSFNGALNQSIDIASTGVDPLDNLSTFSISFWANWQGPQDGGCCGGTFGNVHSRQVNGLASENIIGLSDGDPNAGVLTLQDTAGGPIITGTTAVGDSTWRHVTLTVSAAGNITTMYLDGVLQGTTGAIVNQNHQGPVPAAPLSLGAWTGDGGGWSTSRMDDYGVFSQALTAAEVSAIYSGSTHADLLYDLDEVNSLLDLHTAAAGEVQLDNITWEFATDLTTPIGQFVQGANGQFFLRLDADGSGVQQAVPEPATLGLWSLLGVGLIALWRRHRRQ